MQSLPPMFRNYFCATMAYGFTRAATYDYTGTQLYHNEVSGRYETKEILLIDSIGKVASRTFAAISSGRSCWAKTLRSWSAS
jgi:hypothetical protein